MNQKNKYNATKLFWKIVSSNLLLILFLIIINCVVIFASDVGTISIFTKMISNNAIEKNMNSFKDLIQISSIYSLYFLINSVVESFIQARSETYTRSIIYKKLQNISYEDFIFESESYYVELLDQCSESISDILKYFISHIFPYVFNIIVLIILNWKINTIVFWVILTAAILDNIFGIFVVNNFIGKYAKKHGEIHAEVKSFMNEHLRLRLLTEFFDNYETQEKKLNEIQTREKSVIINNGFRVSLIRTVRIGIFLGSFLIIYLLIPNLIKNLTMTEGTTLIVSIYMKLKVINKAVYKIAEYGAKATESWQKLSLTNRVFEKPDKILSDKIKFKEKINKIEIKNLNFYHDNKKIFENFNLKIEEKKFILIIGESGLGKTTLLNIMGGIFSKYDGEVLINNKNILTIDKSSIKNNITYIMSSTDFLNDTIKNNLRIANSNGNEQEMKKALEIANLKDFVEELPKKLDSQIGNLANSLSTGQKRRLSASICLMNIEKTSLILADEPFNSLDQITSQKFLDNLLEVTKDKILIMTDHTTTSIEKADLILFFEKPGKIIFGTKDFILKNSGKFKEFIQK